MLAVLFLKVACVIYGLVALRGAFHLFRPQPLGEWVPTAGLALGAAVHMAALVARAVELGAFPIANVHDGLSLFGAVVAVVAVFISWRGRVPQVGPLAALLLAGVVMIAVLVEPAGDIPKAYQSAWLPVHIGLAFLADASFLLAGIVSTVYLVQERRLKSKKKRMPKPGTGLHKLPALEILDKLTARLIEVGFPLMTAGIVTGAIYGKRVWDAYWNWQPRTVISVVVWLIFALILHFRLTIGWRGRKAALLTIVGVSATLISAVGLQLLRYTGYVQGYVP